MRILVAPDKFAGTLTARQAADAIATGWRRHAPDDVVTCVPMSDGGPGFREALGDLLHADQSTAYVESADFCGPATIDDPWTGSTAAVGHAVREAITAGATRGDVPLTGGPVGLRDVTSVDLAAVRDALRGVELVGAADVDVPLLGLFGATKTFGPQKGLTEEDLLVVDRILDQFVGATLGSSPSDRRLADTPGAGAAGGLGFAILAAGGTLIRGIELVVDAVGLADACTAHDLVLTGEGTFDHTSRTGKVVYGVAQAAAAAARPCVVLAGQVTIGARESRAIGVDAAYAMADVVGLEASLGDPAGSLAKLAERTARTWSPPV
jgi:glycerate kinase